jgi:hypothetical protein
MTLIPTTLNAKHDDRTRRRERRCAAHVSLRALPAALLDLEDVALGIPEVAPAAAGISVSFDTGYLLHPAGHKVLARRSNVGHRIPDLVAGVVVLRRVTSLHDFEDSSTEASASPCARSHRPKSPIDDIHDR